MILEKNSKWHLITHTNKLKFKFDSEIEIEKKRWYEGVDNVRILREEF